MKSYVLAATLAVLGASADAATLVGNFTGNATTGTYRVTGNADEDLTGEFFSASVDIDDINGMSIGSTNGVSRGGTCCTAFPLNNPMFTYANGSVSGSFGFLEVFNQGRLNLLADVVNGQLTNWRGSYSEGGQNGNGDAYELEATFASLRFDGIYMGAAFVPEPASWALMIAGFGMAGAAVRRRPLHAVALNG